jgi:anti-anti-sigma factor
MELRLLTDNQDICCVESSGNITLEDFLKPPDPLERLLGARCFNRNVLLDLEKTNYVDSSGVSQFIHWHHRFEEAGGKLVFHSLAPMVRHLLKLLQMERVLCLADDEAGARALVHGEH